MPADARGGVFDFSFFIFSGNRDGSDVARGRAALPNGAKRIVRHGAGRPEGNRVDESRERRILGFKEGIFSYVEKSEIGK